MSRPAIAAWYEVPDQRFLSQRQVAESVGVDLHDRRFVDPLEQVLAVRRCGCGRGGRIVVVHPVLA